MINLSRVLRERRERREAARVAAATALLLDRLEEVVGPVKVVDDRAARRLAADMLECSS